MKQMEINKLLFKRLGTSTADGYDLKLVNNIISFNWNNGSSITSPCINTDRWYHVVVTFNGTSYKLYIDGIQVKSAVSGVNPILNNSANCIVEQWIKVMEPLTILRDGWTNYVFGKSN
jgi:hypothetical protein